MQPVEKDLEQYSWFHMAQSIRNKDNTIIAEFPNAKGVSPNTISSPDGNFLVNYQGVFNKENDKLFIQPNFFTKYCVNI